MSIDFTIVCQRPRPADWRADTEISDLPFAFWLETVEPWRSHALESAEENPDDETAVAIAALARQPCSFVARMNCRPAAAELASECAQTLVEHLGGFWYDDHTMEPSPVMPGREGVAGAAVEAAFRKLYSDAVALEERVAERAQREYDKARAADPDAFDEADDWSDV